VGADLYRDDHKEQTKQYEERFDQLVKLRNDAPTPEERDRLQAEIHDLYEKIFRHPYYFRDSYNNSSLFWKLDLSWWGGAPGYMDDDGIMHPDGAQRLLDECKKRSELLAHNVKDLPDEHPTDFDKKYFFDKYDTFLDFLQQVIDGNHTVLCSV
jgi:hypothetical protein